MANQTVRTIDHEEIRDWAQARGGSPAVVADTRGEGGILRIDFGLNDEALEPVSWEEFFRIFDDNDLAFLYQEEGPDDSNFSCKFVMRQDESDVDIDEGDMLE